MQEANQNVSDDDQKIIVKYAFISLFNICILYCKITKNPNVDFNNFPLDIVEQILLTVLCNEYHTRGTSLQKIHHCVSVNRNSHTSHGISHQRNIRSI